MKATWRLWSGRSAVRRWRSIFYGMLAACRGAAEAASIGYPRLVYPYVEKQMTLATPIPAGRLCRLATVSRAGFYRWKSQAPTSNPDMDLREDM